MSSAPFPTVTLRADSAVLEVMPEVGGSVTRYASTEGGRNIEWFRPALPEGLAVREPRATACYPLVPFANRIRYGRFTFGGREIRLPLNMPPDVNAIHGQGWQAPWQVAEEGEGRLTLTYRHAAGDWPWRYDAWQRFHLEPRQLTIVIGVRNDSDTAMPAGLGLHPFFPRTPQCRIAAGLQTIWRGDSETLPTEPGAPPPELAREGMRIDDHSLDNCFAGWSGTARIIWRELDAALEIRGDALYRFFQLYTPAGQGFFCAEPVTHLPDPFTLGQRGVDTGLATLAPGESLEATATFTTSRG